jgi:hypothetical protein
MISDRRNLIKCLLRGKSQNHLNGKEWAFPAGPLPASALPITNVATWWIAVGLLRQALVISRRWTGERQKPCLATTGPNLLPSLDVWKLLPASA